MIRLKEGDFGALLIEQVNIDSLELHDSKPDYIQASIIPTGRDLPIQTDYDFPAIASDYGWEPCPFCRATDGTVDCEHRKTSAMIQSARNFLDNHIGDIAEDPGYFTSAC